MVLKSPGSQSPRSDQSPIRQSFRVSVEPEDGMFAVLNGKTFPVSDISPAGINIFCKDNHAFSLSQVIENCELIISGNAVKGLSAKIIHFVCGAEGQWTCGVQWVDLPDSALEKIVHQVSRIKNKLRQRGSG